MIDEWGIREYVTGQVCDTTASNMGYLRGAAAILERILGRPILWYGCRHHTGELHIKHAYKACRGEVYTKCECKTLFKRLYDNWDDLNTVMRANPGVYQQWAWPRDPNNWKHKRADEVLE